MSKESDDRIRKSKAKLDRLLLIKKAIMDSLSLISRNDRGTAAQKRNNATENGHKPVQSPEFMPCGRKLDRGSQSKNHVDVIRRPAGRQEGRPVLMDPNSQLQSSCQTWPRDGYFGKDFADFCPQFCEPHQRGEFSHVEPPLRVGIRTRVTDTFQVEGPQGCNKLNNKVESPTVKGSLMSIKSEGRPHQAVKSQEVQTDPEIARQRDGDVDHVNADIIRYLNQINDKAIFRSYEPEPTYHSGGFSPLYDMYEERFCFRYQGPQHHPPEDIQMFRPREYNTHPIQQLRRECYAKNNFSSQNDAHHVKHSSPGFQFSNDSKYLAAPYADVRALSDDSGSVFSSEADSDFIFYPCTSLTEPFNRLALVDSRVGGLFSPPGEMPDNISTSFSWRSDLFGSSLDDVTQQFFFDEDALSDDVFLDDPMEYSTARSFNRNPASPCDQASRSFENPLYDSPKLINALVPGLRDELGPRNSSSEDYYAYRYADIDEVLRGCDDTGKTSSVFPGGHVACDNGVLCGHPMDSSELPSYTCLGTEELFDRNRSESSDSRSSSTKEELHFELGQEFAHVFDSLRRNSTQSKARRMWRQRRANTKKKLIQDSNHEPVISSPTTLVFTFEHVTSASRCSDSPGKSPPKPLRGILKNKGNISPTKGESESKLCENVTSGRWVGATKHLLKTNLNHTPLGESVRVEMNENQIPDDRAMERRNDIIKGVTILSNNPAATNQTSNPAKSNHFHEHFQNERHNGRCSSRDQENVLNKRQHSGSRKGGARLQSQNSNQVQNENDSKLLITEETSPQREEKFHILQTSTENGSDEIVAVRKNSLEVYKWTQSLQRRKKRLAKKVTRQISNCCARLSPLDNEKPVTTSATI